MEAVQPEFLTSWKEIARYLSRSVRTVQRWESTGLPVRRMHSGPRAPVVAAIADLDRWIHSAQAHGFDNPQDGRHLLARGTLLQAIKQSRDLRNRTAALRQDGRVALGRLLDNIAALEKSCATRSPRFSAGTADHVQIIEMPRIPPAMLIPVRSAMRHAKGRSLPHS